MLNIYNTLSHEKEKFIPIKKEKVGIYVCGLTVYDYTHLGHARMLVAFDVIVRHLRAKGLNVTYVRNITDIDDKILERALKNDEVFSDLTARFIEAMHEDEKALAVVPPDIEPRATDYIPHMIDLIEILIRKDHAYKAENGDVYFSVANYPEYGRLSRKKMDELLEGARIEIGELKRDPRDFALWKSSPDGSVGWDSPWGYGRPGWHLECSAMSMDTLGECFDIHGGGSDLLFPHHENEIAQSCCASGQKFAKYWMHNGPLRVDNEKMSKSLGNFFTVREVLKKYNPEVVRYLLISSHYRSPINYSDQSLKQSSKALERIYIGLKDLDIMNAKALVNSHFERAYFAAMDDDFNTPAALGVLFEMVAEVNRARDTDIDRACELGKLIVKLGNFLGILYSTPNEFLMGTESSDVDKNEIENLIKEREIARDEKNWQRADEIRAQLSDMKVVVEDGASGSKWRIDR